MLRRLLQSLLLALTWTVAPHLSAQSASATSATGMRDVVLVGNSVSGTVSFLDGHTFENLGAVNALPDISERLAEIARDPIRATAYALIRQAERLARFEPANGDRFVDDVFASPEGTRLYVSRGNLGDVVAIDLATSGHPILWRNRVSGFKADHAALAPDGSRLVVSATTATRADVFDAQTGALVGGFPTGSFPHANDFSSDGQRIYNSSIGNVSLPFLLSPLKGPRQVTVVDANTLQVVRVYPFAAGVRPAAFTPDETIMYAHLSYRNGLVEFDLARGQITRRLNLPYSDFARANYPRFDDYPHNSAHHGLALSGDGARLCSAGTIDNNVAIVATRDFTVQHVIDTGLLPYWAITSHDGKLCLVTISGDNAILALDYASGAAVAQVQVGAFPQRSRLARVPESVLSLLPPAAPQ